MRNVRRIVCADGRDGKSKAIHDGPAPDVRTDPARPGFSSTLIWATDSTPARIARKPARLPHPFSPPPGGSLCRVVTLPPDRDGRRLTEQSRTLDFCLVLEGERVLLLDDGERVLKPGDVVVQLGNWHGWTNPRSGSLMAFVMMGAALENK